MIRKFYNERVEDFCTRLLYFMNTIDSYFFIAGVTSFLIWRRSFVGIAGMLLAILFAWLCFKIADFHPWFLVFSPLYVFLLKSAGALDVAAALKLGAINIAVFVVIQFLFMGIPNAIVSRDPTVPVRMLWNSIWTVAATAVSFSISIYFSWFLAVILLAQPRLNRFDGFVFWCALFLSAVLSRLLIIKTFVSPDFKPVPDPARAVSRVILLNIDGVRLDRFYEAGLPFLKSLEKEATYFPRGLQTVYRALTNPAFASILTGAVPHVHGVRDNNIKRYIRTEALPDVVKTILYGSMHVKHFSKRQWQAKVVSLPVHSVYASDDIMLGWLKADLKARTDVRLFVADISEADFLGHAYGSESSQYLEALRRADRRIADFFAFLKDTGLDKDTVVIICSDHGMKVIDHSYMLFDAEIYVPCLITGRHIKKDNPLPFAASIMDIAPTVAYLLGVKYPQESRGRVLVEAMA
ncbi:MAG TPA: alkaline phosphatase family protein [Patescibacteria group bacterium]|nr:alkaline phosphatase family protein [Patescibacteria group bacterium]